MAKKEIDPQIKAFGEKVGMAGVLSSFPGLIAGQALSDNPELRAAGSALKPLADMAVHHPYGSGIAGAIATGLAGVAGAVIHQRGIAVGKQQAAAEQHEALSKRQFRGRN